MYKILIQIYVLQQKLHVVLTRSLSRSLPLDSHHHRDVFLFHSGLSVAGWMSMRVICQKNLARLLDCVGALKHEGKWRVAAQSEPNTTHYDNVGNHFSSTRI